MVDIASTEPLEEEFYELKMLSCEVVVSVIDLNRFSSYSNLKRVVAWVMRAKRIWLKLASKRGSMTADELADAEFEICRLVQQEAFANEITSLLNN